MNIKSLYELGYKAKLCDESSLIKIIDSKKSIINMYSFGDEDRYQEIIEKLIMGIKNFDF